MTEIFTEDFTDKIPTDAVLAGYTICETVLDFNRRRLQETGTSSLIEDQHDYLNALALFEVYSETHPLNIRYEIPTLGTDAEKNSKAITDFFEKLKANLNEIIVQQKLSDFRRNYEDKFNKTTFYRFTDEERERVKNALHELRVLVGDLDTLDEDQKTHLMNRLGKIHVDIDLTLSDLDHMWGLLGDAFVVNAKHGKAGKLIVGRLYEIVNTVWQVQARTEGINSQNVNPVQLFRDSWPE
jgi:hypothetical protein